MAALALHVLDETVTDFLSFYNPLVLQIRAQLPWFPMPTFTFWPWLGGLIASIAALLLVAPAVGRDAPGTRAASWVLATIMLLNALGHLLGSVYFRRWLPGATSSPLLLVASIQLCRAGRR